MKNYLNNFFKIATQEFGESFEGLDIRDGFAGLIYFSEEHWIDCQITIDEVVIYDSFTDKNHEYMFDAFAEYVQEQIKKHADFCKDIEDTNQSLMYA